MGRNIKRGLVFTVLVMCMVLSPLSLLANTNGRNDTVGSEAFDDSPPSDWSTLAGQPSQDDESGAWITRREMPARQMGLNIMGDMPMITPAFGAAHTFINQRIDDIAEELIAEARRMRGRSVTFTYGISSTPTMVSIVIHGSISSAIYRTLVRSVNFCPYTGAIFTVRDAMGVDIVPLATRILEERMRRSPEHFYALPSVSMGNQAFFMTEDSIIILFDEFQLSSMVSGVFPLELRQSNIRTASISPDMLLPTHHAYQLMMVPLRTVAEQLGYEVGLTASTGRINVWRGAPDEDNLVAWMYAGANEYHALGFVQSLESAPFNRGGRNYVPITFFERILPLTVYHVDSFGNITFLAYSA